MNTNEILSNFLKGNETAPISEKQKNWLLGQAKNEGIKSVFDGFVNYIYLSNCHYAIKQCKTHVSGYGGTRGTKAIQGKYKLEKMYTVKFDTTGITQVCRSADFEHFKKEGHSYTIINQLN
jgi:hypothetical protein